MKLLTILVFISMLICAMSSSAKEQNCAAQLKFAKNFLKLENGGGRLQGKNKIYSLTTDVDDAVWNTAWVTKNYNVDSCELVGKDAIIKVTYKIIGSVSSNEEGFPIFTEETKSEVVEYHVVKKAGHWLMGDVARLRPHVSVNAAVETINQIVERNSFDPAYGKNASKAITALKSATETNRLPASN